mmetsp:Transcript_44009/g.127064  ORF Transcript_44009/g.127064 Transcript_44009/m.127064 type:complete len:204 (+) Transcript_44009:85-696(+)
MTIVAKCRWQSVGCLSGCHLRRIFFCNDVLSERENSRKGSHSAAATDLAFSCNVSSGGTLDSRSARRNLERRSRFSWRNVSMVASYDRSDHIRLACSSCSSSSLFSSRSSKMLIFPCSASTVPFKLSTLSSALIIRDVTEFKSDSFSQVRLLSSASQVSNAAFVTFSKRSGTFTSTRSSNFWSASFMRPRPNSPVTSSAHPCH